jgi:hypothetical protein
VQSRAPSRISKLERTNPALEKMMRSQLIEDLEQHIRNNALRIVDVQDMYLRDEDMDANRIIRKWISLIKKSKRTRHFKGTVVVAGGITFFTDSNNPDKLLNYEHALLNEIAEVGSLRVVCCYLEESLDKMHFSGLVSLVTAHQCAINSSHISIECRQLHASVIMEALAEGTEEVLGRGSWNLIRRTMKLIYGINENTFVSNPAVFEEKLRKVLGASSEIVVASITKKVKKLLA